jgi:hypothetical protein
LVSVESKVLVPGETSLLDEQQDGLRTESNKRDTSAQREKANA